MWYFRKMGLCFGNCVLLQLYLKVVSVMPKMEQAKEFVEEFAVQIAEKWYRFYILKEPLTCEKINKKI